MYYTGLVHNVLYNYKKCLGFLINNYTCMYSFVTGAGQNNVKPLNIPFLNTVLSVRPHVTELRCCKIQQL